jgi:hypothetical protein
MRILLLLFSVLLALLKPTEARAQDFIITIAGDTLKGKVQQTNDQFVFYRTSKTKRGESDVISRKEVREILYGAYDVSARESNDLVKPRRDDAFSVWGGGGFSRILESDADISDDFKDYYDRLKSGYWIGGGVNFFPANELGFGVLYSTASFSNSITVQQTTTGRVGTLADNITLQYIGANLALRLQGAEDWYVIMLNVGPGLSLYRNDAQLFNGYLLQSNALGIHLNGEFGASLGQGMYIGLQLGFKGISHSDYTYTPAADMPADLVEELRSLLDASVPFNVFRMDVGVTFSISF